MLRYGPTVFPFEPKCAHYSIIPNYRQIDFCGAGDAPALLADARGFDYNERNFPKGNAVPTKTKATSNFPKPSKELIDLFNQTIAPIPSATPRKMFGCPCSFVNGNMFAGVFADSLFLRLPVDERLAFAKFGARPFEPLPGRVMREYVVVPPGTLKAKARLNAWIEKSFAYAAALPPKVKKPSAKEKAK
jgi:TfoX/Sxy family transcriptional regulator of competence genes